MKLLWASWVLKLSGEPLPGCILFDCVKAELSEGLGLVVSWPNKDPVVDTEGQKKRNGPGLKAMKSMLLFSAFPQRAKI